MNEFGGSVNETSYSKYYKNNYNVNGSPQGYDLEKIYKDPQGNIANAISLSKYYYHKNGLIMRVVNIIRDFGIGEPELNFPTKNTKAKKVITEFNKRINITEILKDMMFELALTGNCVGYNRGNRIDIYPITRVKVTSLIVDNKPILQYINDFSDDIDIDITDDLASKLEESYPVEVVEGMKKNKDKITLNTKNTFFSKTNSSRYEAYGVSFLIPAFDELSHKNLLKEAEKATASGIIDKILKIGVGDKDHSPTQPEIDFYKNLIGDKKGSLKVTVPYFVDFEWIEPTTDIFGVEKFEQVDKDLLSALGVSLTLIRGEGGGNYSEGVISVAGLIKSIDSLRSDIPGIIREWYVQELQKNGLSEAHAPEVKLPRIEIDNSARMEMVQWLFQNAGMPYEVLYNECGYNYTSIKLLRQDENNDKTEDIFKLRQQPFQGQAAKIGAPEKNNSQRKTDKSKTANNNTPKPNQKKTM